MKRAAIAAFCRFVLPRNMRDSWALVIGIGRAVGTAGDDVVEELTSLDMVMSLIWCGRFPSASKVVGDRRTASAACDDLIHRAAERTERRSVGLSVLCCRELFDVAVEPARSSN